MTRMLTFIPEEQRQEMCAKTLDAAACAEIVASIAGLSRTAPADVKATIATSLDRGTVSTTLSDALRRLKPVRVTAGSAKGWDVVIRWCGGLFAARNQARAMETARALGRVPGERIAPGVTLGAIDVVQSPMRPGAGAYIASDAGLGKADAVAAIRATLSTRGIDRYGVQDSATVAKWRVDLIECESNIAVQGGTRL